MKKNYARTIFAPFPQFSEFFSQNTASFTARPQQAGGRQRHIHIYLVLSVVCAFQFWRTKQHFWCPKNWKGRGSFRRPTNCLLMATQSLIYWPPNKKNFTPSTTIKKSSVSTLNRILLTNGSNHLIVSVGRIIKVNTFSNIWHLYSWFFNSFLRFIF